MRKGKVQMDKFAELRAQAEEILRHKLEEQKDPELGELGELIHELAVYQTELNIQNEELRRAQRELEESRDRFIDLYDFAPVGYLTISQKGIILEANLTCAMMLGLSKTDLIKKPMSSLIFREDQDIYYIHRKALFETSNPQICEIRLVKKDGSNFDARIEACLAKSYQGDLVCRVTISDDTVRIQAEAKLREYSERLEEMVEEQTQELRDAQEQLIRQEKLAALGKLAGGVAHELRNPMGVLINAVYYLKMTNADLDETTKEYLNIILLEVRKSEKIVSDLLRFASSSSAATENVSVLELIDPVMLEHKPPEEIRIIRKIATNLPLVMVDPFQMRQVLTNLVVNAYQAMPDGGELTISGELDGDSVALSIRDTGRGIPDEHIDKIFEPLYTTKTRGIGLGLAISEHLVEANGGRLIVESDGVGEGSQFTVYMRTATVS